MGITVRGMVLPSWGGKSRAVRVLIQDELEEWWLREKVTTKLLYEPDREGIKRPSIYLSDRMAAAVQEGDMVKLEIEARDTKRGRNLKLVSISKFPD